jgi:hypothetical protein
MVKTVITWGVIIFVAFYLVTQPTSSGHLIASAPWPARRRKFARPLRGLAVPVVDACA